MPHSRARRLGVKGNRFRESGSRIRAIPLAVHAGAHSEKSCATTSPQRDHTAAAPTSDGSSAAPAAKRRPPARPLASHPPYVPGTSSSGSISTSPVVLVEASRECRPDTQSAAGRSIRQHMKEGSDQSGPSAHSSARHPAPAGPRAQAPQGLSDLSGWLRVPDRRSSSRLYKVAAYRTATLPSSRRIASRYACIASTSTRFGRPGCVAASSSAVSVALGLFALMSLYLGSKIQSVVSPSDGVTSSEMSGRFEKLTLCSPIALGFAE